MRYLVRVADLDPFEPAGPSGYFFAGNIWVACQKRLNSGHGPNNICVLVGGYDLEHVNLTLVGLIIFGALKQTDRCWKVIFEAREQVGISDSVAMLSQGLRFTNGEFDWVVFGNKLN